MNSKIIFFTLFKIQDPENHTLFRGTYLFGANKGVPPPPPPHTPGQKHWWREPLFVLLVAEKIEAKLQMFYLSTKDIRHAKSLVWSDKKKLMWADWGKDALRLFNENCAWENSNVLGLLISKGIFSGIEYVQDFFRHGLMASLWSKENTESDILQN